MNAHQERTHALLGASKAAQWIHCPPSARLQESVPECRSEYADEGTLAHELSELMLIRKLEIFEDEDQSEIDAQMALCRQQPLYSAQMESAVNDYVLAVEERYMEARSRSKDAVILIEERLDFSEWVPDGYGTGDVVIISDGVLEVIDLKFGKGVPVSAIGNPQLRLYGLGAWWSHSWLYSIHEIRMTIIQPRLDSISTDTMRLGELIEWAETIVKPAAALADAGDGEFKAGEHCRWCKVKATCKARADANMAALKYEFKDPALMTHEEIGSILFIAEQLKAWAKDVEDYAYDQAIHGQRIPGWKLVEGRSNRVIVDKRSAYTTLSEYYEDDYFTKPRDLLGIGDLEKKIGKKELTALIGNLIQKPPGKPVLVAETDKRPEINSIDSDFQNMDMEA
jgi:hypothetical protein